MDDDCHLHLELRLTIFGVVRRPMQPLCSPFQKPLAYDTCLMSPLWRHASRERARSSSERVGGVTFDELFFVGNVQWVDIRVIEQPILDLDQLSANGSAMDGDSSRRI